MADLTALEDHPAKFTDSILVTMRAMIRREAITLGFKPRLLDPFAGTGKIHELGDVAYTTGVELEPEWAACHPRTRVDDATRLPRWWARRFHIVATSPCYGNRLADHHNAADASERHGYKFSLGRAPSPGSGAVLQWGPEYRAMHMLAWTEVARVIVPGGLFLLNVSDHQRDKVLQPVAAWHVDWLVSHGWRIALEVPVPTPRHRHGENHEARAPFELVVALRAAG